MTLSDFENSFVIPKIFKIFGILLYLTFLDHYNFSILVFFKDLIYDLIKKVFYWLNKS